MVDLRGVSHQVDGTVILNDITTRFQPNRFNVILGPNGRGSQPCCAWRPACCSLRLARSATGTGS